MPLQRNWSWLDRCSRIGDTLRHKDHITHAAAHVARRLLHIFRRHPRISDKFALTMYLHGSSIAPQAGRSPHIPDIDEYTVPLAHGLRDLRASQSCHRSMFRKSAHTKNTPLYNPYILDSVKKKMLAWCPLFSMDKLLPFRMIFSRPRIG